jgi:polyphosphate kinase
VHLSTGNYNPQTARIYTDLSFFTCNGDFCQDVSALFNYLTGYCELPEWRKLIVAPSRLQSFMIEQIEHEMAVQKGGGQGRIIAKINGLLEPAVVQALYRSSRAGVKTDIICRGICALRPQMPGISENIRVISIVDRFLEHSRVFYFGNNGDPQVYIGSADWMDRNLSRRVEVVFPIDNPDLKQRIIREMLAVSLADNEKARELLADGSYRRIVPGPGQTPSRSQQRFLEISMQNAARRQSDSTVPVSPTPPTTPATQRVRTIRKRQAK